MHSDTRGLTAVRLFIAEAFATFSLCFIGILAIAFSEGDLLAIALAHGLTITAMVAAIGGISGAHINPAVTFGFVATGRMSSTVGLLYVAAQLVGAIVAGLALLVLLGEQSAGVEGARAIIAAGTPALAEGIGFGSGLLFEIVATFFLVFVIFGSAVDSRAPASAFPLAIGLAVIVGVLSIGPLTGAAMNPARHFGPALVSGAWGDVLLYWIGPMTGAGLAALLQHFVMIDRSPSEETAEHGGTSPKEERG